MKLGIAVTSYMITWRPTDTLEFLEHCHSIGAAGIQVELNGDLRTLRDRAERYGMYIEAFLPLLEGCDSGEFEQKLKDAKAAGAVAIRAALLERRRYEAFVSLDDWRAHVEQSTRELELARPLLDRYKIPLGIENHKDWTADELCKLMDRYGTEYLGVCLDFGNNISLLDDPMTAIEQLAPFTVSTHLKNMATRPYESGLLLSEVMLEDGYLELHRAISLVRNARPGTRFSLEMITRDPLRVPLLEDSYWATFPDRKAIDLARTLRFVKENASLKALPMMSHLSHEDQLRQENDNVIACLRYAENSLKSEA
jgi:sugar phosphate isomerase/epimerase